VTKPKKNKPKLPKGYYWRGNNIWISYQDARGRQERESTGTDNLEDAKKIRAKRIVEVSEGQTPGKYFKKVSYDELADDLETEYRYKNRRSDVRRWNLDKFFSGMKATDITTPVIQKFIQERLEQNAAHSTINRDLAALRRMLRLGYQQTPKKIKEIPYIPFFDESENVREFFYTHEEYLQIQKVAQEKYPYLVGPIQFAYTIGWRRKAITSMTWDWLNMKEKSIYLPAGHAKNKRPLWVKLPESIFEMFSESFKNRQLGCPYVFHRDGQQIKNFRYAWAKILDACKFTGYRFHDFRRCAIRNLIRAGVDEETAMMISGHKTREVFRRYDIKDEADLEEAARKIEAYHNELNEIR